VSLAGVSVPCQCHSRAIFRQNLGCAPNLPGPAVARFPEWFSMAKRTGFPPGSSRRDTGSRQVNQYALGSRKDRMASVAGDESMVD
jgi:hypothetical protein